MAAIIALAPVSASAAPDAPPPDMASRLLQGCLAEPSAASTARLAASVGATAFADARNKRALSQRDTTTVPDVRTPGDVDRTDAEITAFQGWTLPEPGGGQLAYVEELFRKVKVEQATGRAVAAVHASHSRACSFSLRVASGWVVFEAYEALHGGDYGALITADRRHIIVFRFNPDAYDIELDIGLDAPSPARRSGLKRSPPAGSCSAMADRGSSMASCPASPASA